jgi:hypothetical protein
MRPSGLICDAGTDSAAGVPVTQLTVMARIEKHLINEVRKVNTDGSIC